MKKKKNVSLADDQEYYRLLNKLMGKGKNKVNLLYTKNVKEVYAHENVTIDSWNHD